MSHSPEDSEGPQAQRADGAPLAGPVATDCGKPGEASEQGSIKLLSRSEAARAFDVSVTTFRRRYEGRALQPIVGQDGAHYFRQEAVEELVIQQRGAAALESFDGALAAAVFRLLEEGIQPVEVVMRLKVHPRTVAAIQADWMSLRGGYVVPGEVAREIDSLPWMMGALPIRDGARLLKNLKASAPVRRCRECEGADPEICAECARRLSLAQAARRAAEARERAERAQHDRGMASWERSFYGGLKRRPPT